MSTRAFPARSRLEIVDDDDRFTRPTDTDTAPTSPTPEAATTAPTRARRAAATSKAPAPAKTAPKTAVKATPKAPAKAAAKTPVKGATRGAASAGATTPPARRRSTASKTASTKTAAAAKAAPDPGSFTPAARVQGMGTSAIQAYVRQDLRDRINGVVTAAQLDEDLAGLDSLTAFVEWALDRATTHVEATFNKGEPYPTPRRLRKAPRS